MNLFSFMCGIGDHVFRSKNQNDYMALPIGLITVTGVKEMFSRSEMVY